MILYVLFAFLGLGSTHSVLAAETLPDKNNPPSTALPREVARTLQEHHPLVSMQIENDTIWIAASDAIFNYNSRTSRLQKIELPFPHPINHENLIQHFVVFENELWVATKTHVFTVFLNRDDWDQYSFTEFTGQNEGLHIVNQLAADNDSIWIGSSTGLFVISRSSRTMRQIEKITQNNTAMKIAATELLFNNRNYLFIKTNKHTLLLDKTESRWRYIPIQDIQTIKQGRDYFLASRPSDVLLLDPENLKVQKKITLKSYFSQKRFVAISENYHAYLSDAAFLRVFQINDHQSTTLSLESNEHFPLSNRAKQTQIQKNFLVVLQAADLKIIDLRTLF